jgi:hypothetical protein
MFELPHQLIQDLANVSLVVGGLVAVLSIWILFRELRENNKLTRASNTQALVELSAPFYLGLIQDRQMAELYARGASSWDDMDDVDRNRYKSLLVWWLVFHENVYYQFRNGLLDNHSYKPWAKDLVQFTHEQGVGRHWPAMRHLFQDEFAIHVSRILEAPPLRVVPPVATAPSLRA